MAYLSSLSDPGSKQRYRIRTNENEQNTTPILVGFSMGESRGESEENLRGEGAKRYNKVSLL